MCTPPTEAYRATGASWELWDTLQSWQVATAVIGTILKVTYETPSAHQMQQYEQLKFDTHSPYWLPFLCLLLLTAVKLGAKLWKQVMRDLFFRRVWTDPLKTRSRCLCAYGRGCVGIRVFIWCWWLSVPSIQKCFANFIQEQTSTFDNKHIKQWMKNGSTGGIFYSESEVKREPGAPPLCLCQSHGIIHPSGRLSSLSLYGA